MKLLIDANLSPKILEPLRQAGYAVQQVAELRVTDLASLLVSNLPLIAAELERGAIASLSPVRLAVRDLPLK